MPSREELLAEAAREEARLAGRAAEVEAASARLAALREQLASAPVTLIVAEPTPAAGAATPATNADKVALFRSLFRGRDDVFPRRWENTAKAKSGYSAACANEWERGVCEKKKGSGSSAWASSGRAPGPPKGRLPAGGRRLPPEEGPRCDRI